MKKSVHQKVKYPNLCDYEATQKANLKSHKQRKHLIQLTWSYKKKYVC